MSLLIEEITQLLAQKFENTSCFLVDIKVSTNNHRIQIFIDCLPNIKIKQCVEISRYLEKQLEEKELVPAKYILEVSSPGLDRPFKVKAQYTQNIGRNLEIKLLDGTTRTGMLMEVTEVDIIIDEEYLLPKTTGLKSKKKRLQRRKVSIPFSEIKTTIHKISF